MSAVRSRRPRAAFTLAQLAQILNGDVRDDSFLRTTRSGPFVEAYLEWFQLGKRSPATVDAYKRDLAKLCLAVPNLTPGEIGVQDLMLVLQFTPPGSWKRVRSAWNGFFRWSLRNGHTKQNPVELLPELKAEAPRVYPIFSAAERARLVKECAYTLTPEFDTARMLLLLETGARKSEAIGMRIEHIDLTHGVVLLYGKGAKERVVPIHGDVVLAVERMLMTPVPMVREGDKIGPRPLRRGDHIWFGMNAVGDQRILRCYPERPMSKRGWHEWYARIAKEALGPSYRKPHMARHTFATDALDATEGKDLYGVKELLGHESIRTTEVYLHSSRRRLQHVADALATFRRQLDEG